MKPREVQREDASATLSIYRYRKRERIEDRGWRMEDGGWRMEDNNSQLIPFYLSLPQDSILHTNNNTGSKQQDDDDDDDDDGQHTFVNFCCLVHHCNRYTPTYSHTTHNFNYYSNINKSN